MHIEEMKTFGEQIRQNIMEPFFAFHLPLYKRMNVLSKLAFRSVSCE